MIYKAPSSSSNRGA